MARIVAQKLGEAWKVPIVVENKAGGNAQIGAEQVAKGASDGSQLLAITLTHAANVSLFPNAPYSFTKDLRQVSKAKQLNAGNSGNGSPPHLTCALFNDLNKTEMTHVPYRGGALSMNDLVGGQLDVVFSNMPESLALVKGGKLKALAVCSLQRNALLPDVPTVLEAGKPGLLVENWTAAMIHANTPDAIVEKYAREIIKAMFSKDVEDRARVQGFKVSPKGPQDFSEFLSAEITRWSRLIKAAKITAA